MSPLLFVDSATIKFGGLSAIQDITFHLDSKELLGVIGPNGAGKTTLMRTITGIYQSQKGSIELEGIQISNLPIHKRVKSGLSMSQQLVRPFKSMNFLDNVIFAAGHRKTQKPLKTIFLKSRIEEKQKAMNLLEQLGISDMALEKPEKAPLGYLKRLELARAMALEPKILILDEPLAGLNQGEAEKLADILRTLNQQGQTMILIEHNLREVMRICSRLIVLNNGKILAEGEPNSVFKQTRVQEAYLGEKINAGT